MIRSHLCPWAGRIAVFAAAIVLAACSTPKADPRGLSTRIEALRFIDGPSPVLRCEVRLLNGSVLPYVIDGSEHRVFINGASAGTGVSAAAMGIRGQDTTLFEVTIAPVGGAAAGALRACGPEGRVDYRIESLLRMNHRSERSKWRTEYSGSAPVHAGSDPGQRDVP